MRRWGTVLVAVACLLGLVAVGLVWPERPAHADSGTTSRPTARLATSSVPDDGFAVVGHRGYPGRGVTENTLPAFRRALRAGATAVELDVQLTRDGRLLVLHDPTLDRTTTCRGRADRRTLAQVQRHCRGRRGHELLPSLGQVLDLVARLRAHVVVDVKRRPSAWTHERYARLVHTIEQRGLQDRTILLGFHRESLESLRALDPALRVQAIASDPADVARMRTWADGINLPASLATVDLVSSLRADGVSVLGRRTGSRSDWSRLRRAGADGVLTDRVASYVSWARG
jgi:glycerophosphoryl diester phosphodiesterase